MILNFSNQLLTKHFVEIDGGHNHQIRKFTSVYGSSEFSIISGKMIFFIDTKSKKIEKTSI